MAESTSLALGDEIARESVRSLGGGAGDVAKGDTRIDLADGAQPYVTSACIKKRVDSKWPPLPMLVESFHYDACALHESAAMGVEFGPGLFVINANAPKDTACVALELMCGKYDARIECLTNKARHAKIRDALHPRFDEQGTVAPQEAVDECALLTLDGSPAPLQSFAPRRAPRGFGNPSVIRAELSVHEKVIQFCEACDALHPHKLQLRRQCKAQAETTIVALGGDIGLAHELPESFFPRRILVELRCNPV